MNSSVAIVIPVFNEKDAVVDTIKNIRSNPSLKDYELIVVDDGSDDGTYELLTNLQNQLKNEFTLLHFDHNLGYGSALKHGINNANSEYIIITDADNTYPNDQIPKLTDICIQGKYDMVVGARTMPNSNIPTIRKPAKWILRKLANILVGYKIPDLNSGLRVFKKELAKKFHNLICDGFSFTTTITLAFLCNNYRVKYTPIEYFARTGSSKIKPFRDTINFITLIVTTVLYFRPLRILFIPGILIFSLGISLAIEGIALNHSVGKSSLLLIQISFYFLVTALLADLIVKTRKS
ncbi:MAG: glycosyltransferase family 2 protein [Gammaproteobacteria bacterium]|jgi:glycosyltransferase involved in cell wall biosynthesis